MADRKTHWENVYSGKSPLEVSWYQREPALSLQLIADTGLGKAAGVIDVGGGASTLVDRLCDAGYTAVTVLDVSAQALTHARQRLGHQSAGVAWVEADVTEFDSPQRFELWHDRAVFHFLTDGADRQKYVASLKRALLPGGHVVMMTFAIGGPKKCSGLDIVQYDAEKIRLELGPDFDLLDTGHDLHTTPSGAEQRFAWFHLVRKAD